MPEASFRQEFGNSWVSSSAGWLPPSVWERCGRARLSAPRAKDAPVVAVETDPDGQRVSLVTVWDAGGKIGVTAEAFDSVERAWRRVAALKPRKVLLPPSLAVHYPGDSRVVAIVGSREIRTFLPAVTRAITEKRVTYRLDAHYLTDHVLRAASAANHSDGALTLSTVKSNGPITAARAMVWAIGEHLRPRAAKPQIVSA